jgi:hypothetical protein
MPAPLPGTRRPPDYCSEACRKAADQARERDRGQRRAAERRAARPRPPERCDICGGPIPPREPGKGGPPAKRCSEECRKEAARRTSAEFYEKNREEQQQWQREYRARNPEQVRAANKRWREANQAYLEVYNDAYLTPEVRRANVQREQERYRADPEKFREKARDRYASNAEGYAARKRAQRAANPEAARAAGRRATAKRRAAERRVAFEPFDDWDIYERDGWVCALCDYPIDPALAGQHMPWAPTIDHRVPIYGHGPHVEGNAQAAHRGCNSSKQARSVWTSNDRARRRRLFELAHPDHPAVTGMAEDQGRLFEAG